MAVAKETAQIETRLEVLAELLDQAVKEVRRTISEIKSGAVAEPPPSTPASLPTVVVTERPEE